MCSLNKSMRLLKVSLLVLRFKIVRTRRNHTLSKIPTLAVRAVMKFRKLPFTLPTMLLPLVRYVRALPMEWE